MRIRWKRLGQIVLILGFTWLSVSCSRVNQKNFDKVQSNMTMQEVVSILGEPSTSNSINIAGISGTAATWKHGDTEINVQFLNNKVAIKFFNK